MSSSLSMSDCCHVRQKAHHPPEPPNPLSCDTALGNRVLTTKRCFVIAMTTCRHRISQRATLYFQFRTVIGRGGPSGNPLQHNPALWGYVIGD